MPINFSGNKDKMKPLQCIYYEGTKFYIKCMVPFLIR